MDSWGDNFWVTESALCERDKERPDNTIAFQTPRHTQRLKHKFFLKKMSKSVDFWEPPWPECDRPPPPGGDEVTE